MDNETQPQFPQPQQPVGPQPVLPPQPPVAPSGQYTPSSQPPVLPPAKKSKKPLIIGSVIVVLVIIAVVVTILVGHKSSSPKTTSKPAQTTSNSMSSKPTGSSSSGSSTADNQAAARNAKRQNDIEALQTQLEAYFQSSGYYPSLTDMNSASWRGANLQSLDSTTLVDPSSTCDPSASACLVATPAAKSYAYAVTDSSGNSCESSDTQCAKYTLTATYEGRVNGANVFSKSNLD